MCIGKDLLMGILYHGNSIWTAVSVLGLGKGYGSRYLAFAGVFLSYTEQDPLNV